MSRVTAICVSICVILVFIYLNIFVGSLETPKIELLNGTPSTNITNLPTLALYKIILGIVFTIPAVIVIIGIIVGIRRKSK